MIAKVQLNKLLDVILSRNQKLVNMIDRETLQKEWGEISKQLNQLQIKLQRIDFALKSKEDDLAEEMIKDGTYLIETNMNGADLALVDKDDIYLINRQDEWLYKLTLKEKITREDYIKLVNKQNEQESN